MSGPQRKRAEPPITCAIGESHVSLPFGRSNSKSNSENKRTRAVISLSWSKIPPRCAGAEMKQQRLTFSLVGAP